MKQLEGMVANEGLNQDKKVQNYCGSPSCPDCAAREFVRALKRQGQTLRSATFTHWPGTDTEVSDDLISGLRTGSF